MSTSTGRLKLTLRVFNVILIALSALSIVWLAIMPFVEVKASYLLTADTVKEVIGDNVDQEKVHIDEIVGDGIEIKLGVKVTPTMLLKSFTTSDSKQFIRDDVISPTVDSILEQVMPTIKEIAKQAVKAEAKAQLTDYLQDAFNDAFGEANVDVEAKLEEAGINIDEIMDTVYDAFTEEGAVFNSDDPENPGVVQILLEQVNNTGESVYEHFFPDDDTKTWEDITLDDPQVAETIDKVEDTLKELGLIDEEGKILDFEQMLSVLIDKAMGTTASTESEHPAESTAIDPLNRVYAEEELSEEEQAEVEEKTETLADKVKNLIYEKLPSGIEGPISIGFKVAAGVLGLFIFTWGFVALFALLKTIFGRNPGIFTGLISWLSALLQLIFGLVLTFGVSFVLSGKLNIPYVNDLLGRIPAGLSVSIMTSAMIPAFCVLAKFVLTWFYHPTKRRLKKRLDRE